MTLLRLTGALLRRLAREGIVVRSLLFPPIITAATLLMTLGVVALVRTPTVVAVTPDLLDARLTESLERRGLLAQASDDPRAEVAEGRAGAGTDGHTLWTVEVDRATLLAEAGVRERLGSSWRPAPGPLPRSADTGGLGTLIGRLLCAIYALYGVVFGAGMVARDWDDGTLEVELSLAVPRWLHGAARWIAGTSVLAGFLLLAVWLYHALAQIEDPAAVIRHGIAATAVSTALGLASVGRSGLQAGFAASLAGGLTVTTGLLGLGFALPAVGAWLPLASVMAGGPGWVPLAGAALLSPVGIAVWTVRSARA